VHVYENTVYDCNINMRIHHVNEPNQAHHKSQADEEIAYR